MSEIMISEMVGGGKPKTENSTTLKRVEARKARREGSPYSQVSSELKTKRQHGIANNVGDHVGDQPNLLTKTPPSEFRWRRKTL